jgi:hypothetical protein
MLNKANRIKSSLPFITHFRFLSIFKWQLKLWKYFFCGHGIHLWDEILGTDHYLNCDACQLMVKIEGIDAPTSSSTLFSITHPCHVQIENAEAGYRWIVKDYANTVLCYGEWLESHEKVQKDYVSFRLRFPDFPPIAVVSSRPLFIIDEGKIVGTNENEIVKFTLME